MKNYCYPCCTFVTASKKFKEIFENIKEIARADCTVLIKGETGVGKEVLACIMHKESKRKNFPFIKLNCAAVPKDLFEAEIFGFEKGAFTSAYYSKKGKIQIANSGTFLLDEISEIPMETQAKLLRVIEYGEIQRLGSERIENVDVRFIATTNRDLKKLVKEGRFRDDLYYRISPITIEIPPLRERKEDIPVIFNYYLNIFMEKYKKNKIKFEKNFEKKISEYPFYGNVRELKALAEKIVLISNEKEVKINDFLDMEKKEENNLKLKEAIRRFEIDYINKVLKEHNGNKKKTAEILGISRKTIWLKLKNK